VPEESKSQKEQVLEQLPGLDCGSCGFRSCAEFAAAFAQGEGNVDRCVTLSADAREQLTRRGAKQGQRVGSALEMESPQNTWKDFLGREYDFVLQIFPGEPGPRETILPHNPTLTEKMQIQKGDILIGRPLGMSCGCPITHCGVVMDVDYRTGVMVWCVTGPLQPRLKGYKDIGYYIAEAYEGLVRESKKELRVGMRYWFIPRMCMLQWRHSGLINFMNKTEYGTQVRIEGLMIG